MSPYIVRARRKKGQPRNVYLPPSYGQIHRVESTARPGRDAEYFEERQRLLRRGLSELEVEMLLFVYEHQPVAALAVRENFGLSRSDAAWRLRKLSQRDLAICTNGMWRTMPAAFEILNRSQPKGAA